MFGEPPFGYHQMRMREVDVRRMIKDAQARLEANPGLRVEVILEAGGSIAGSWIEDGRRGVEVFDERDGVVSTRTIDITRVAGVGIVGDEGSHVDVSREPVPPSRRDATIAACLLQSAIGGMQAAVPSIDTLAAAGIDVSFAVDAGAHDRHDAVETLRPIHAGSMLEAAVRMVARSWIPTQGAEGADGLAWPEIRDLLVDAFGGADDDTLAKAAAIMEGAEGAEIQPTAERLAELAPRLLAAHAFTSLRGRYRPFMPREALLGDAHGELNRRPRAAS